MFLEGVFRRCVRSSGVEYLPGAHRPLPLIASTTKTNKRTVGVEIECLEFLRLPWTEHCSALDNSSFSLWVQDTGFHLPKSELHRDEKLTQHRTFFLGPQL